MGREAAAGRPEGVVTHLIDFAIAAVVVGVALTLYAHYYGPFAIPSNPIRWQNVAMVPLMFFTDLRVAAGGLAKPVLLAFAALPVLLIATVVVTVNSRLSRWLRIVCHGIAGAALVAGSIVLAAMLRVQLP